MKAMGVAALISWLVTAFFGLCLLAGSAVRAKVWKADWVGVYKTGDIAGYHPESREFIISEGRLRGRRP
jgi:hypothetical protein